MKTLKTLAIAATIALASGLSAQSAHAFCCGFWGFSGGFHVGSGWGWGGPWGYYPGWGVWDPYYGYPLAGYPVYSLPPLVLTAPEVVAQK